MRILTAAMAAMALSACGGDKDGSIETEDGSIDYSVSQDADGRNIRLSNGESEATVEMGETLDPQLPKGIAVYPGGKVVSVTNVGMGGASKGSIVSMTADDAPEKVVAWYRKQAADAGFAIESEVTTGELEIVSGKAPDGREFSVTASKDGAGASVQLIAGDGLPG